MWLDIYKHARDTLEKDSAFNHLYLIKAESDLTLLRRGIAAFREKFGRWPGALAELVSAGPLSSLPVDFSGRDYIYDPGRGAVSAQRIFQWKRR
jgi:hypothetical protein